MFKSTTLAALALSFMAAPVLAQTDITWWHGMGGRNGEVINEISQKFNESQQACHLTPVSKGTYEEALASGIAAFRSGEQPNILQVFDAGAATIMAAKGATIAAEDLIKGQGERFDRKDFIDGVSHFYADSDGKFVGMPFNSSAPIMYFNTEAFEKAGVEPPKTWEEFETIAPKLKAAGYLPMTASQLTWMMVENFHSRNNQQFATNNNGYDAIKGTELTVNTPEQIMMFDKLKDWADKGWYGFYGAGWSDNLKPFEEGKVAMWIGSSGSFGGLQKSATAPFSAVFMPYWASLADHQMQSFIGGAALFAMAGKPDDQNKCTAQFFSFLTSPEIQVYWHENTGYVPVTTAAYELAKKQGYYEKNPVAEVGIKQLMLPGGEWTKGYRLGFYPQIRTIEEREFNKIFSGETTPKAAFETIETEGNALLARFAKTSS
ncbi:extracellular solute-binding protein [Thioclava sp. BHET1]|uniref:sn-glycerol-3-phosphate-binding periplasmic protein UgpB n=1 Tax=Thioclava dalianensis TaxID=1185766 RepID=A0A074TB86_9RHOB|nr:extracellular solute-binding protein [Thioclava dalianensis]KEP68964.1 glycerol 3-phosphate ABC transporter substrate-binding protein [Thioclava dalianensis]TMV91850.1 extracellular solute-binding protein [Thioclava sp. BHET1]SFN73550.1 sn-glycerol 3-phosphate transport system substrate-binding protein [Thioclava dalianensis]